MRLLLSVLAVTVAGSAHAQVFPDPLPPLHTSGARAYAYSAAATAGGIGLGYVLYRALPEGDPTLDSFSPRDAGLLVIAIGAVGGPAVGNLTLGAEGDVRRGLLIRSAGLCVAAGLAAATFAVCAPGLGDASSTCDATANAFVVGGAVALGAGLLGGAVYDLATIPGNAREARRQRGRVQVAPAGAGLMVTVRLVRAD